MKPISVITLVGDLLLGGDENRVLTMSRYLDRSRFRHRVVTMYARNQEVEARAGHLYDEFARCGIEVLSLGIPRPDPTGRQSWVTRRMRGIATLPKMIKAFEQVARTCTPDIVDSHLTAAGFVAARTKKRIRSRLMVTAYEPLHVHNRVDRWFVQYALARADAICTDSQVRLDEFSRQLRNSEALRACIPNGVQAPESGESRESMRRRLAIPAECDVVIGQIARLRPFKGQAILLQAARQIQESHPNVYFLLVGHAAEPAYKCHLQSIVSALPFPGRAQIVGYPGPVGDIWKVIDIHAHPTLRDSLPNAIIEGMSYGRPCVATHVGGIPELIQHDRTGLLVSPHNVPTLEAALHRLVVSPGLRRTMGDAARRRYEQIAHPRVFVAQMQKLFEDLTGSSRGSLEKGSTDAKLAEPTT